MGDVSGEPRTDPMRRRRAIAARAALGCVLLFIAIAVIVIRAKSVDHAEYDVLERFVEEAFPAESYDVGSIRLSDAKPCMVWCPDYVLHVDLRTTLASDVDTNPAERCADVKTAISTLVGESPYEPDGYHYRECFYIWSDFEYGGRTLRLDVDVADDPMRPTEILVRNESAHRAVLPF